MASPASLREFRFKVSTTHRRSYENAASSDWNAADYTAHKLRMVAFDDSGLEQPGIADETIQTRMHALGAPTPGLRRGSLKVSTYAGGAWANVGVSPEWNIVACAAGGVTVPTTVKTDASEGGTTTNVLATGASTYCVPGQAVLVGSAHDGRGGGQIFPVNSVTAEGLETSIAMNAASIAGDALIYSHSYYPDETAPQQYIDTYCLGHGVIDHVQTIGGRVSFGLSGMGVGEIPKLDFDVVPTDWQYVETAGDRSALTSGTTPDGGEPAFNRSIGWVHIGDYGDSTRSSFKCGDISFSPGLVTDDVPEPSGINGVGGAQHMPGVATLELTLLLDEDSGLFSDWTSGTSKHVLVQLGSEATKAIAIELKRAYLDAKPAPAAIGNLRGLKLVMHADEVYDSTSAILSAPWLIHVH